LALIPHPREDKAGLIAHWERCRGNLEGGLIKVEKGRDAVFIANGVCGMASLLLMEAFLIGKPVLSLQPALRRPRLAFLQQKGFEFFVTEEALAQFQLARWVSQISRADRASVLHPEMALHRNASLRLATVIEETCNVTNPAII